MGARPWALLATVALGPSHASPADYFRISVVDGETLLGVPLVRGRSRTFMRFALCALKGAGCACAFGSLPNIFGLMQRNDAIPCAGAASDWELHRLIHRQRRKRRVSGETLARAHTHVCMHARTHASTQRNATQRTKALKHARACTRTHARLRIGTTRDAPVPLNHRGNAVPLMHEWAWSRCRCGIGPDADVGLVPVQMWVRSRCRCGRGPGPDVGVVLTN
jgi:hypothetical protein